MGSLPTETQDLVDEVTDGADGATFGLIGVLIVLISATSLSRALIRAYDSIWMHGRTRTQLSQAWRWFVAVIGLALAVAVTQKAVAVLEPVPPSDWWSSALVVAVNVGIATLIPWLLLGARVPVRWLLPGGLLFALGMFLAHPISSRYLGTAIEVSAARFGAIGVAFSYLTYLYAVSWWLLATAIVGQVIAADEAPLGRFVRGEGADDRPGLAPPTLNAEPEEP